MNWKSQPVLGRGYATEWYSSFSDISSFLVFNLFHFTSIWPLPLATGIVSLLSAKETSRGGYYSQNADLPKERWKEPCKSQEMLNILSFCCGWPKEQEKRFHALKWTRSTTYTMEQITQQKESQKKESELLETHTCEQQGFIAPSSHQVKQDRDVPPLGRGGFMPVGPSPSKWWIATSRLNSISCS